MRTYDSYKNSNIEWIGEIPSHWKVVKSKQGFIRNKGKAFQENPVILSLTSKGIVIRDISKNDGQIAGSYFDYNLVSPGDLLLNPMDLVTNAFAFVSELTGVISPAYFNLKSREGFVSDYYKFYFQLQYWNSSFFHHGKGVSIEHRWTLNEETFKNFPIPVPPISEQRAIAKYLDQKTSEIDELIVTKKRLLELYKEEKNVIINNAITHGIISSLEMKDSGSEWLGEIPSHWELTRLRYLGSFQNGINIGADSFGKGTPFVSYSDVYKNRVIPTEVQGLVAASEKDKENYSVMEGDVFFTRTSETVEEIGIASTCLKTIPDAVFAGFLIRFRPSTEKLSKKFSKFYFRAQIHRRFFVKEMNIVTRASLSQDLLKKMPVLLPPIEEQEAIVRYIEAECACIDSKVDKTKRVIKMLTEYRTALISEVVTGKLKVIDGI